MNKNELNINLLGLAHEEVYKLDISSLEAGKIESLIDRVQESLITQSAGVMPKVFDEWHKRNLELCICYQDEINLLIHSYINPSPSSKVNYDFIAWLMRDGTKNTIDKLLMCIDAIKYGYEVEK